MARILVVDDNAANLELMVYLLRAFGHSPHGVSSALDGLLETKNGYDLILSDIRMPDMDGYEFARRVRSETHAQKAALVAVTALAMVGDRERVLAAGFDGYISKPIDPQRFVGQVEAFLPAPLRSKP